MSVPWSADVWAMIRWCVCQTGPWSADVWAMVFWCAGYHPLVCKGHGPQQISKWSTVAYTSHCPCQIQWHTYIKPWWWQTTMKWIAVWILDVHIGLCIVWLIYWVLRNTLKHRNTFIAKLKLMWLIEIEMNWRTNIGILTSLFSFHKRSAINLWKISTMMNKKFQLDNLLINIVISLLI